jgi:anthranilate phosphoribosyltransferase
MAGFLTVAGTSAPSSRTLAAWEKGTTWAKPVVRANSSCRHEFIPAEPKVSPERYHISMSLVPYLEQLSERRHLTTSEAEAAMHTILSGQANHVQIAAFLMALRINGETADELVGFARAMRRVAVPVDAGLNGEALLDTCGTGGDGLGTFNISTLVAFVVAGAGVRVAKHGNRSISGSRGGGSADLLESFGIRLAIPPSETARAIREIGIGFLFAPAVHTAMKHAQPVRLDLGLRTVFNLLGPLTNPAGATVQVVGTPSARAAELIAAALAGLGLRRGFVVHGSDGLDEITTTGPTLAYEIREGIVSSRTLEPSDFGVPIADPQSLKGGGKERNLEIAQSVLADQPGPCRDIVLVNAAAALVAAGRTATFLEAMPMAAQSLASGAAQAKLQALARFTQQAGGV